MTDSGGRGEGLPGDGGMVVPADEARAAKQAAKAAARAGKAEARAARAVRKAAKVEAKAVARALEAADKAARKAAKAAARADSRALRAARYVERKAAKAEAKAQKAARREAKSQARIAKRSGMVAPSAERAISPAMAAASAVLDEVAELMWQGEAPGAAGDLEATEGPRATPGEPGPEPAFEAEPQPEPEMTRASEAESQTTQEPEAAAPEPEPEPEPDMAPASEDAEPPAAPAAPEPTSGGQRIATPAGAPVAAAIDVGATSVHLLVGMVDGHRVDPLLDESVFLGLGDRVSAAGFVGDAARSALVGELARYAAAARELGAQSITIVGTDPMRRAADAAAIVHEVRERVGVALHVLDHAEEGLLTLVGAMGGSPVLGELLLVDVGGGSSEFVVMRPDGTARSMGVPLGAARLTQQLVRSDPPSAEEIEALRAETSRQIAAAPDASPVEIVAVGGTASNLLRLLPAAVLDRSLTRRRIAVALAMLTVEGSGEAATRHLVRPERARILPAGAIIMDTVLETYAADRLRVSEAGIREGAILAAAHGGAAWRDRLSDLARGWAEPAPSG
jgi:exopolyphosphatase/guanosine-5'-triphosphate,3'-diphosphate pyrophosphatase